ncbi:hypothetical protein I3B23_22655 [Salmonella enterica]|nr:hypothetical protein [Salmonella enterica]
MEISGEKASRRHKEKYATQMTTLKQDLQALLGKK